MGEIKDKTGEIFFGQCVLFSFGEGRGFFLISTV